MDTHPALGTILQKKRRMIESQRETLTKLRDRIDSIHNAPSPSRGFISALQRCIGAGRPAIIAEIKKASPSKGLLSPDFDPKHMAELYAANGASCLSVLTEESAFLGYPDDLILASQSVSLPVLRKDFMIDPLQIYESRSLGADCILLILSILNDDVAHELETIAHNLGLDVLIEVHSSDDVTRACDMKSQLIGINNRNLKTLDVDPMYALKLVDACPDDALIVAESGLGDPATLRPYFDRGIYAFLIGETFMRASDPGSVLLRYSNQSWLT